MKLINNKIGIILLIAILAFVSCSNASTNPPIEEQKPADVAFPADILEGQLVTPEELNLLAIDDVGFTYTIMEISKNKLIAQANELKTALDKVPANASNTAIKAEVNRGTNHIKNSNSFSNMDSFLYIVFSSINTNIDTFEMVPTEENYLNAFRTQMYMDYRMTPTMEQTAELDALYAQIGNITREQLNNYIKNDMIPALSLRLDISVNDVKMIINQIALAEQAWALSDDAWSRGQIPVISSEYARDPFNTRYMLDRTISDSKTPRFTKTKGIEK